MSSFGFDYKENSDKRTVQIAGKEDRNADYIGSCKL